MLSLMLRIVLHLKGKVPVQDMKAYGGVKLLLHAFLIWAPDGGE